MAVEDSTGAGVTIVLDESGPIGAFRLRADDGSSAGRADFVDPPGGVEERIFFHTEVDPAFSGRGLARQLVRAALADSITKQLTVVPVCPLFAAHLEEHGEQFTAEGGRFRRPTHADIDLVKRVMASGS